MKIALTTLTPLWTGGTNPKEMKRIQELGIVGSLRWWYETIVRGLTGAGCAQDKVCDPTGPAAGRCKYVEKENEWVCHACRLFGATGWARQFNLELNGGSRLFTAGNQITLGAPGGRNGWVFGNPMTSYRTPITGALHRVRGGHTINDLAVIMAFISRWGGLAAKTQHGFGVVQMQMENEEGEIVPYRLGDFLRFDATATDAADLPSLKNLFFAKLYFKDGVDDKWWRDANLGTGTIPGGGDWPKSDPRRVSAPFSVPIAPAIKYKVRFGGMPAKTSYLAATQYHEPFFFGEAGQNNRKAMLNVSHAYKDGRRWQFRLWGWLPEQNVNGLNRNINREQLMHQLHQLATSDAAFWHAIFNADVIDFNRSIWRELNTGHTRNTPAPAINPDSCASFLRELLS